MPRSNSAGLEQTPRSLCAQVEELLVAVLRLGPSSPRHQYIAFFDATAGLKGVDLSVLRDADADGGSGADGTSRFASSFFMNLYHTLLLHAYLVLGAPRYEVRWAQLHHNCCYVVGGVLLSLAEIEHCVLRGRLSPPNGRAASKLVPDVAARGDAAGPRRTFPCARDERYNLALNTGSVCCLPEIMVFEPSTFNSRLHEYCTRMLDATVLVQHDRRTITLPRIFKWHIEDFGGNPTACVRATLRFLSRAKWEQVSFALEAHWRIKWSKMSWVCRESFRLWTS